MPADTTISLNIQQIQNNQIPQGFRQAKLPDGSNAEYCYKYAGGNWTDRDGQQSFKFTPGTGTKTVEITLNPGDVSTWTITAVTITFDPVNGQQPPADVSAAEDPANPGSWLITDTDADTESGTFDVTAHHEVSGGGDIICDPRWINTP